MRIVLLNPPVPGRKFTNRDLMGGMGIDDGFGVGLGPRFVSLLKNEGTRLPVISLAYGAAILGEEHDVVGIDLGKYDPADPEALAKVRDAKPDWIVAATSYAFLGAELKFLRRMHEETGAKRLLVGYAATHFGQEILDQGLAEAITAGDPEIAFQHLAAGTLTAGLDGVWMRPGANDARHLTPLVAGPPRDGYLHDLDSLPFPRWDVFDVAEYGYFPLLKKRPFLTLLSSRGCPYNCGFCPYPIGQGSPFRARSARNVVDEMEHLSRRFGVKSILFRDPTFTLDMKRAKDISRLLIERKLGVEFGIETRLDRMDEEMITLLAEAGCRSCEFGVDPVDEQVRKASNRRGMPPERAEGLIRAMEEQGIAAAGLAVIGVPGEGIDEVERTLAWIEHTEMSYANYEIATPFPGTPLYAEAVEKGWAAPHRLSDLLAGDPKLGYNGVIDLDAMKALQDRALQRFYLRPRKIAKEIFNKDFVENLRFMATSGWKFVRQQLQ